MRAESEDRVKLAIEREWMFASLFRVHVYRSEAELAVIRERKIANTYESAILLFPNLFTRKKLIEFIEKAKALRYPSDSIEEKRKQLLIEIFQGMLIFSSKTPRKVRMKNNFYFINFESKK